MKISNNLLQDANFRKNLEDNLKFIEQNIEQQTLWNCGITSKGIAIVSQDDSIIAKIVFLVKKLFGYVDTSYASMQELKRRVMIAELTELTGKIVTVKQNLEDINHQNTLTEKDLRTKTDQVKSATQELDILNASVSPKKRELIILEKEIEAKKTVLEALEGKLKTIAKEEELETKLKAQRLATQTITKEIEEITENLGSKHAELISRIGNTELGVAGWLANANQMIKEKEKALKDLLSYEAYIKPYDAWGVVLNQFREELHRLNNLIPLIINPKQYTDFLSQLHKIETTGWSYIYYNHSYTVTPKSQSSLQKTILREIKELVELIFTRRQIMALTK